MPDDETELSPEEEQVRRLLADARHTDPVPADVAARLDAVLADLRSEPRVVDPLDRPLARPADLAAARRRRNARTWLVAAAAVVAVGVGISHLDLSGPDDDAGSSADSGSSVAGSRGSTTASGPAPEAAPSATAGLARLVPLDPDRFGAQVQRLATRSDELRSLPGAAAQEDSASSTASAPGPLSFDLNAPAGCLRADHGRGRALPVTYGGRPGVLVFRPVRGDTRVVDLFLCGHHAAERSITLPAG